jgi:hypothetical protein
LFQDLIKLLSNDSSLQAEDRNTNIHTHTQRYSIPSSSRKKSQQ